MAIVERSAAGSDLAEYKDFGGGVYRAASFSDGRIETFLVEFGPARMRATGMW